MCSANILPASVLGPSHLSQFSPLHQELEDGLTVPERANRNDLQKLSRSKRPCNLGGLEHGSYKLGVGWLGSATIPELLHTPLDVPPDLFFSNGI